MNKTYPPKITYNNAVYKLTYYSTYFYEYEKISTNHNVKVYETLVYASNDVLVQHSIKKLIKEFYTNTEGILITYG